MFSVCDRQYMDLLNRLDAVAEVIASPHKIGRETPLDLAD